jgi:hypothetical protein
MDFEHDVKVLPIDGNFPAAVDQIQKEGWQLIPNIMPIAIYHVIRPRLSQGDMQLKLNIDDSKIGILRNGKMVVE